MQTIVAYGSFEQLVLYTKCALIARVRKRIFTFLLKRSVFNDTQFANGKIWQG